MAITHTETDVTWPTTTTYGAVTTGSNATSDAMALDDTCVAASITIKCDNQSTPAADDQLYVWLLQSMDGTDYDTVNHALLLGIGDTNSEDPATFTVPFPLPQANFKVYAEGASAGTTNTIWAYATLIEQRAA